MQNTHTLSITPLSSGEYHSNPGESCQLSTIHSMAEPLSKFEKTWQIPNHLKRFLKRRMFYIKNWTRESVNKKKVIQVHSLPNSLQPGDLVQVKRREEILETLNRWNQLGGCGFMEEMWAFCGTKQQVLKRVERFLDERDYQVKHCKNVFILEGVHCSGTVDFGPCDRSCYFFWREEWLQKLPTVEREK